MNKIENNIIVRKRSRSSRFRGFIRRNRMIIICLAMLALVGLGWWHTMTSFVPKTNEIRSAQASMQSELDLMQEDLTRISEEVEAWPGITEIPDETIPALADPTTQTEPLAESMTSIGKFKIYAYFKGPNGLLTATGTTCSEGRTVAADFDVLKPGTRIYIDGVGERIVEDCGVSDRTLDLYMVNESDCWDWGKQSREVWVIE